MDSMLQDFRYALRVVTKNRGLSFAAILALALGIGDLQCGICGVAPPAAIPRSGPAGAALADTSSFRLASASFFVS